MPTVLREGPYRYFFYSGDRDEPKHIHIARDDCVAKCWLDPVRIERSGGLRRSEIYLVQRTVEKNREAFLEAWRAYFDD